MTGNRPFDRVSIEIATVMTEAVRTRFLILRRFFVGSPLDGVGCLGARCCHPRHFSFRALEGRVIRRRIANSTGETPLLLVVGQGPGFFFRLWFSFNFLVLIFAFLLARLNCVTLFLTVPEEKCIYLRFCSRPRLISLKQWSSTRTSHVGSSDNLLS